MIGPVMYEKVEQWLLIRVDFKYYSYRVPHAYLYEWGGGAPPTGEGFKSRCVWLGHNNGIVIKFKA